MFNKKFSTYLEIANISSKTGKKMWFREERRIGLGEADKIFRLVSAFELQRSHPHRLKLQTSHCDAGFTAVRPQSALVHFVSWNQFLAECIVTQI